MPMHQQGLSPDKLVAVDALVSGAWNRDQNLATTFAGVGDSFTFNWNTGVLSNLVFTRSNGVVTVTGSGLASHQFYVGQLIQVSAMLNLTDNVAGVPITARIAGTSISYTHAGPDGVMPQRFAAGITSLQSNQAVSLFSHLNRLVGGGLTLVANAGFSGATSDFIADMVPLRISPAMPQRVIWWAGYNDISSGFTAEQSAANCKRAVDAYPAGMWEVFSVFPWLAGATNDDSGTTGAKMREQQRSYQVLKRVFANYANVRVHNSHALIGLSTGFAKAGYINSIDKTHPTPRACWEIGKYLAALDSTSQTPIPLPCTALDTYALDATSRNMVDNPLNVTQTAISAPATGFMPVGCTASIPSFAVAAAGTVTANPRADGFGNDFALSYTPNIAGSVQLLGGLTVGRFTSGQVLEQLAMKISLSQSGTRDIKVVGVNLVVIADGVTYTTLCGDNTGGAATGEEYLQEDLVDVIVSMRNVRLPVFTTLSTLRMDLFVSHAGGGGPVVLKAAQRQVVIAAA